MKTFLKNWDLRRLLYLLVGVWMIFQAVHDGMWWFAIFGVYFASMSIFRVGCAAGNCVNNNCEIETKENL